MQEGSSPLLCVVLSLFLLLERKRSKDGSIQQGMLMEAAELYLLCMGTASFCMLTFMLVLFIMSGVN